MKASALENSLTKRLLDRELNAGNRVYLRQPRHGKWHEFTWAEVMQQARQVAFFLQSLGLKKGAHVAIFSKNCAEWFIADFGICLAGMVNVPLFPNQHEESIDYVLKHAEVKLVFVGKLDNHARQRSYIPEKIPTVSFDYHDDLATTHYWADIRDAAPLQDIALPAADDLYTIIYSSGTSGTPKGVMFTHEAIDNYLTVFPDDLRRTVTRDHFHLISYLPLAHVYERSAIQLGSLTIPCDVSFVESLDTFADNLREIKPTLFAAVPRIWGVFKQKIEQKLSPHLLGFVLSIPFLSSHIQNKIKHQLGLDQCANNFSGASHLPLSMSEFFEKLDLPIQEGYGQTENLAYATLSLLDERKPGYVGTPGLQVEIKQGDDNELLMKCPCLMKGYYKDPKASAEAFTDDGWFRTGDIVEIDDLNRVKILGRISENFKNQKGEFIAPSPIEKRFSSSKQIDNLCLVGRELPSNVLLVTLTEEAQNKPKDELKEHMQKKLHTINSKLENYEKISHILIVKEQWTPENGLLTPTLKVKRREIEAHYHDFIQEAMEQSDAVVWE